MRKTKIKTIDVTALEWFDKTYGNSYFAGTISINYGTKSQREYSMPFQYGYGECYIDIANQTLKQQGEKIPRDNCDVPYASMSRMCRENGIILRTTKHENCKKSELENL